MDMSNPTQATTCEMLCSKQATTEVAWTNFSGLPRETLMCTECAKDFVSKHDSRVKYAVAIHPANARQRKHRAAWKAN